MSHFIFAAQIFEFPQPEKAMLAVYIGFIAVFLVGFAGKNLPSILGVSESNQVSIDLREVPPEPVEGPFEVSEG